jgi:hypothetical protein
VPAAVSASSRSAKRQLVARQRRRGFAHHLRFDDDPIEPQRILEELPERKVVCAARAPEVDDGQAALRAGLRRETIREREQAVGIRGRHLQRGPPGQFVAVGLGLLADHAREVRFLVPPTATGAERVGAAGVGDSLVVVPRLQPWLEPREDRRHEMINMHRGFGWMDLPFSRFASLAAKAPRFNAKPCRPPPRDLLL